MIVILLQQIIWLRFLLLLYGNVYEKSIEKANLDVDE